MLDNSSVRFYLQRLGDNGYEDTTITQIPQPFIPLEEVSFLGSKKVAWYYIQVLWRIHQELVKSLERIFVYVCGYLKILLLIPLVGILILN